VTTDDRLFCWGLNIFGQLGDPTISQSLQPVRIARDQAFRQVSAGRLHTCAVTPGHVAYCWGHGQAGTLGNGTADGSRVPVRVARGLAFREVSAGTQFTCGVTTDDVAFCWGLNSSGQLGVGTDTGPELCFTGDGDNACSTRPVRVLRKLSWRRVEAGDSHACGVTPDEVAACWGADLVGQLGRGAGTGVALSPVRVAGSLAFAGIGIGSFHGCGVTTERITYCWGENGVGQLGTGSDSGPETCSDQDVPCSTGPSPVAGGLAFLRVTGGRRHTCGLTPAGVAFCWGANESGQLGDGTTLPRLRPRRVAGS
jgi:alpha-tubulin suppressor-like RCC1 family protein